MEERAHKPIIIPLTRNEGIELPPKNKKEDQKSLNKATQTLFKTLSQNNYRLQETIDRKANIIISVNAIILSVLLGGGLLGSGLTLLSSQAIIILAITSSLSILSALISIKPFLFTSKSSSWYGDALLSHDTAIRLNLEEYKKKVKRTLKKEKRIYDAIIEDIYFISMNTDRKHKFLMVSAVLFFVGLFLAIVSIT